MTPLLSTLIGAGLVLLGILGIVFALQAGPIRFRSPSDRALRRLERKLRLSMRERHLLKQLAHAINEQDHSCLLIGRGCFEAAVAKYPHTERALARIESLRSRIFEEESVSNQLITSV